MATGMALTVVQTLLSALQTQELRELCSMFGYESQLADLQGTVETINAVLLDAESKHQELSNQGKDWLAKLKDAVYDAEDLFDDFNAMNEQQRSLPGGKISKKVRRFFSSDNQLLFAASTSRKIKKLREKLDKIARDRTQFGFSDVYIPVKRREEPLSYVHESNIIGRDAEREAIMGLLLGDVGSSSIDVQNNICFVSIVGIGGLGKTAIAQLVYNDDRIKSAFEVSFWVCVSEKFSMEEILSKMAEKELRKESLLREVRRQIEGKRYLLVLDDVWNESRNEWEKLRGFLLLGARGSRILVTSRSQKVARAIGDYPLYPLQGLSDENSWLLFEKIAFNQGSRQLVNDDLIDIGKDIVKKCANVPLSIKVISSMLYDQDKSKWVAFQKMDLAKMCEGDDGIMPILKFSYYHLTPDLKSCFSYCALFPKDYVITKRFLINLWAAQGCLKPLNEHQSMEDVGEENFLILSQRCFLQDIELNDYGETYRCKMHDLIHDLALRVAGKELYLMLETSRSPIDGNTRYLSIAYWRSSLLANSVIPKMKGLRTFFWPSSRAVDCESQVVTMLANCRRLRILDLHKTSLKVLPSTFSKLSHLRYLDLSDNYRLAVLPESISGLHHLQVLILRDLIDLKELPKDFGKLVNLRHLELDGCSSLTHMPAGMSNLTNLRTLTTYVLGEGSSKQSHIGQLKDLEPLKNLSWFVKIIFNKGYMFDATSAGEGAFLLDKINIKVLHIHERGTWAHDDERHYMQPVIIDETLLERLEPHQGLIKLNLVGYIGSQMPRWGITLGMSFPRLVNVSLAHFPNLLRLPPLCLLQRLHTLSLRDMPKVEYMEEGDGSSSTVSSFLSLEFLTLDDLPSMKSFPEFLHVKEVHFSGLNKALTFCRRSNDINSSGGNHVINLESLKIDNLELLDSLFGKYLHSIRSLTLLNNSEVETLSSSTVVNVYQRHTSSIVYLRFQGCPNLKSLSGGGIEHLNNLQKLTIWKCHSLNFEDENAVPWRALHTLPHLCLAFLPQLVHLPRGLRYLSSLQALELSSCHNLYEDLPDWFQCFGSLQTLYLDGCPTLKSLPESILGSLTRLHIFGCPLLTERYREPLGKDWPKICHIPDTYIFNS